MSYSKNKRNNNHENNKKTKLPAIINAVSFFLFLGVTAIFMFVWERPEISEIENRKLSEMPVFTAEGFFSGEYTEKLSMYFNDTVPGRDYFKKIASNIKSLSGLAFDNVEVYGSLKPVVKTDENDTIEPVSTTSIKITEIIEENDFPVDENVTSAGSETKMESDTDISEVAEQPPENERVEDITEAPNQNDEDVTKKENNDVIAVEFYDEYTPIVAFQDGHWRGISMYHGGKGTAYAESINAFKKDLGDGVNVYSMIAPTSGAFYTPESYEQYNASQLETLESIKNLLVDIVNVDCYSALEEKKDELIYTRTDHHWQPLGAYYAAKEFALAAGVLFAELSDYTPVIIPDYVGTMYGYTDSANLLNDSEEFIYYKPNNDYTAYYYTTDYVYEYEFPLFVQQPLSQSYSTFMGGDAKIVRIETDVKNGRKLAVLKDSYGNAEIPFYTSSFEEIYVLDIRYFDLNAISFIKEHEITDVLFTMCIFSVFEPNVSCIEKIRIQ